jgi:hypothetical protein
MTHVISHVTRRGSALSGLAVAALLASATPGPAGRVAAAPPEWDGCLTSDAETGELRIDALCFFDALIDRYQGLTAYEDVADVLQVTERRGEASERVETRIGCEIEGGKLRVRTPKSEARRLIGLGVPARLSPAMEAALLRYQIWLAPHMALRFADRPQENFRVGVRDGLVATEAERVQVGDRSMVHLKLESGGGSDEASFDLFVNPESMLVERITGRQRLPDGAQYATTLDITPTHVDDAPVSEVGDQVGDEAGEVTTQAGRTATPTRTVPAVIVPPMR